MATRLQVIYTPDSATLDKGFMVHVIHRDLTPGKTYSAQRPEYDLFEDPDGGCKELGARILAAVQDQYPDAAVTLTVDGKSNNEI